MRILSFGGGIDSTAILCLMAQGKIARADKIVFSNVGERAESEYTLAYIREIIIPYCKEHSLDFIEVSKKNKRGESVDLLEYALSQDKSFPIVQYLSNGSPSNRTCTLNFKVKPIDKFLGNGSHIVIIGFNASEKYRADKRPLEQISKNGKQIKRFEYPLIELGITRDKAISIIESEGLPVPPKSSCWFCPFGARNKVLSAKNKAQWDYLQKWIILETIINKKRAAHNRDNMYFYPITRGKMQSLYNAVIAAYQLELFEEICDSGYCGL